MTMRGRMEQVTPPKCYLRPRRPSNYRPTPTTRLTENIWDYIVGCAMEWDGFNEQCGSSSLLPASMLPLPLLSTPALNSALQCFAISHNNPVVDCRYMRDGQHTVPVHCCIGLFHTARVKLCCPFYSTQHPPFLCHVGVPFFPSFLSLHLCVKSLFGRRGRERETMGRSVFILAYRGTIPRQNITIHYHLY